MAIKKIVYTFTALYDDAELSDEAIQNTDLSTLVEACQFGEMIGEESLVEISEVAPENVEDELLAIGNDGHFFKTFYDTEDEVA